MPKKVCIIIVTYNGRQFISDCLNSIFSQPNNDDFGVVVVDNNSQDQTKAIIKKEFPGVTLIENSKNDGFAKANNLGVRKALVLGAGAVVLLNQDTEAADNFVTQSIDYLQNNPRVFLASPVIFYPDKKRIWFAGAKIYRDLEILTYPKLKIGDHIHKKRIFTDADKKNQVDWLPACALWIRKEVFEKIGYFDESFFMYGEDVDFSLRAKKAGFKLGLILNTFVVHKENYDYHPRLNKYWLKKLCFRIRARLKIVWRYYSWPEKCYYIIKCGYAPIIQLIYGFKKIFS